MTDGHGCPAAKGNRRAGRVSVQIHSDGWHSWAFPSQAPHREHLGHYGPYRSTAEGVGARAWSNWLERGAG